MRILVVGGGSWDDTSSLGNTMSNFFAGWEEDIFYNLYFRETRPNNSVCKHYYQITTKELLKKYFNRKTIGRRFDFDCTESTGIDKAGEKEKKAISMIHRFGLNSVYNLEDFLWSKKKWINKSLDQFIDEVQPDIIFSFAAGNKYMVLPIEYIKSRTNAKVVLFVADDMYTAYRMSNNSHHKRMRKDFDRLIRMADKVYGITEEMCTYYKELYSIPVTTLYKGCSFETSPKQHVNDPVRFVYAGNLLYGRDQTLCLVVDALEQINKNGTKAILDIYSGTILSDDLLQRLNRKNTSVFHGQTSYEDVKKQMANADVTMHVESFDETQIKMVRYSFSTKIIDCLQSGSVMLAIGPRGQSSIEYSQTVPGAIVIDNIDNVFEKLQKMLEEKNDLVDRARLIREFAVARHDIDGVRRRLRNDFKAILHAEP